MGHLHRVIATSVLTLGLAACPGGERAPNAAGAVAVERCTLETPLEPGIPGSPGHLIPSARNPNGESELTALMREMVDDLEAIRAAIAAGGSLGPLPERHFRIRCAWPTTPKDRDAGYDVMAALYLDRLEDLYAAEEDLHGHYDALVSACVTCHQARCQGPLPAIEALRRPAPRP